MHRTRLQSVRIFTLALAAGGAMLGGGCASYVNVPEPDSPAAVSSPNARQPRAVMATALRRVVTLYPPGPETARYGVALPPGTTAQTTDEILAALGPQAAPVFGMSDLPTYTVGRIWIRSGKAKVDIFRPVVEIGRQAGGLYEKQAITVWLEGGLDPWRVRRVQVWEIGAFPNPDIADPFETPFGADPAGEPQPAPEPAAPEAEQAEPPSGAAAPEADPQPEPAPRPSPAPAPARDDGVIRVEPLAPADPSAGARGSSSWSRGS